MMRRETLICVGIGVPRVRNQKFVQQRRASSPMSDDEDRCMLDLYGIHSPLVKEFLSYAQHRIHGRKTGDRQRQGDPCWRDRQPVAGQQSQPDGQRHAMPKTGSDERIRMKVVVDARRFSGRAFRHGNRR